MIFTQSNFKLTGQSRNTAPTVHVGFEVITAVVTKSSNFWHITSCSVVTCFSVGSLLAYSSALKMETNCFSRNVVDFQRTTRRYIPKERIFLILPNLSKKFRVLFLIFAFQIFFFKYDLEQEVLGRTNCLFSSYTTRFAQKMIPPLIFYGHMNMFTEPLPSIDRGTNKHRLMDGTPLG
jgi:hypothetical protein